MGAGRVQDRLCIEKVFSWNLYQISHLLLLTLVSSWHFLLLSSVSLMTPRSLYIFFSPCLLTPRTGSQCLLSLLRILIGVSKGFQRMHSAKGGDKTLPNSMSTVRMKVEVVKTKPWCETSKKCKLKLCAAFLVLQTWNWTIKSLLNSTFSALLHSSLLLSALLFFTLRYSTLLFSTFVHSVLLFSILHFPALPCSILRFPALFYSSLL